MIKRIILLKFMNLNLRLLQRIYISVAQQL